MGQLKDINFDGLHDRSKGALLAFTEGEIDKEQLKAELDAGTKAKIDSCTVTGKDGKKRFDYLKMSQMYHSGKW